MTKLSIKILVLCTGNSCRSQIAEGWLRHFAENKAEVYSAGIEVHGVNQTAIEIMLESGIDISEHKSNHIDEYQNMNFDFIITVCDHAKENCPYLPSKAVRFHHNFIDPSKTQGSREEILNTFRQIRDEIRDYSKNFINENL